MPVILRFGKILPEPSLCSRSSRLRVLGTLFFLALVCAAAQAQQGLTWEQTRARFEINNPDLLADSGSIGESKIQEISADLRPNPSLTLSTDGTQIAPYKGVWQPFNGTMFTTN